jgi:hypothetical protein
MSSKLQPDRLSPLPGRHQPPPGRLGHLHAWATCGPRCGLVGAPWAGPWALDRRDGIHDLLQQHGVVSVSRR